MPTSSAESTMPSAARAMPHSAEMPGAAKALDSTSNPSSALSSTISDDDDPLPRAHRVVVDHADRVGARLRCRPCSVILSLDALSFVDSRQHFHQFFDFLRR